MRKLINQATVQFISRSANEGFARTAAACFAAQLDPTLEEINDLKTAVSEAVTNAIIHGYGAGKGTVRMHATCSDDGVVVIDIIDRGRGISDVAHARQPFYTTSEGDERSGMGFTVMESFMDAVEVRSAVGHGTTVRLVKQINARSETFARRA